MMKLASVFFYFSIIAGTSLVAQDQNMICASDTSDLRMQLNSVFHTDQILVNGVYFRNYYRNDLGHPFLIEDEFQKGSLVFRELQYSDILMKYDIFQQELLIKYSKGNNQLQLYPPKHFITEFKFQNRLFRQYAFEDEPKFYQVIAPEQGDSSLACLYYWHKIRSTSDHNSKVMAYAFSNDRRKSYLKYGGSVSRYYSKNSFLQLFSKSLQSSIKKYLKSHKIRMGRCSDMQMQELMNYCYKLIKQFEAGE